MLQISRIRVRTVRIPFKKPLVNAVFSMTGAQHVFCELETADGLTGLGEAMCFEPEHAAALHRLVEAHASKLLGQDASLIRKQRGRILTTMGGIGFSGMPMMALGAVDCALWDLFAKSLGVPVYKLLGAEKTEVPVYVTGGWLCPEEELVEEALSYYRQGFRRFKMKLGMKDWREDIERVKAVQEACPDLEVMVDINQGWDVKKAMFMAPKLLELGITHLEEPVPAYHFAEQKLLRKSLGMDVVAGEKLYGTSETTQLLMQGCVDRMNPDLARCGGVTGLMEVCRVASACHVPVSSHGYSDQSAHVIAAEPAGTAVEVLPVWEHGLFREDFRVEGNMHRFSDKPGFGTELSDASLHENLVLGTEQS